MTCNTFNAPTSKFSTYALTQEQLLSQIDSFDTIIGKQNDPINNYDINVVVKTIADTYTLFNNYDSVTKHEDYPYLSDRLTRTFITPSEYAEFLNTSKITIDDATKITTERSPPLVLRYILINLITIITRTLQTAKPVDSVHRLLVV